MVKGSNLAFIGERVILTEREREKERKTDRRADTQTISQIDR
jgi:hypothetical protein